MAQGYGSLMVHHCSCTSTFGTHGCVQPQHPSENGQDTDWMHAAHPKQHWQCDGISRVALPQKNHLSGLRQSLLKVIFWNSQHLMEVRREMQPVIRRNKNKANVNDAYKAFGPQRNNNTVKLQVGDWAA